MPVKTHPSMPFAVIFYGYRWRNARCIGVTITRALYLDLIYNLHSVYIYRHIILVSYEYNTSTTIALCIYYRRQAVRSDDLPDVIHYLNYHHYNII